MYGQIQVYRSYPIPCVYLRDTRCTPSSMHKFLPGLSDPSISRLYASSAHVHRYPGP
jgi:hypothetical protein